VTFPAGGAFLVVYCGFSPPRFPFGVTVMFGFGAVCSVMFSICFSFDPFRVFFPYRRQLAGATFFGFYGERHDPRFFHTGNTRAFPEPFS